jgi:hypothetical protein
MEYKCNICNKKYSSYQSLWIHNKKYHTQTTTIIAQTTTPIPQNTTLNNYECEFCKKKLSRQDSLKRHQTKCKMLKTEREKLKEEIKNELKLEFGKTAKIINNVHGNMINGNNTDNGPKLTIYKTGTENMIQLDYKDVSTIFDNEISSVIKLIDLVNFNDKLPQNHSFCSTSLESPYLSFYNTETNTQNKERKKYFFEDVICKSIQNHEILFGKYKTKFNSIKRRQIEDNIANLKRLRDSGFNNKILQEMIRKLNLLSYNKRELIQKTWNGEIDYNNSDDEFMKIILKDNDDDDNSISSMSSDSDSGELKTTKITKNKDIDL